MSTGLEKLRTDTQLQNHWIRRFIAMIIDAIIAGIAVWILTLILSLPFLIIGVPWGWGFTSFLIWGVIWFLYASFAESSMGWTIGKQVVNLKVKTVEDRIPTIDVTFIRNISKIFWLLYLLDVIVGLATPGDPTQKYTDRIAGTIVVSVAPTTATSVTTTPGFTPVP
ncbi:MAG: RDD family protein [Candidatus Bathyarchaeia archaeon]